MGYSFHWPSGSISPFFVLPESNQRVHLQVVDYLPYLVDMHNVEGLSKNTPTSALPVREPASSSTAPGADPGTGSGPPAVEVTTAAGNGGKGEDEQEPEMTKSVKEQLQAQAKSLGHLMSHHPSIHSAEPVWKDAPGRNLGERGAWRPQGKPSLERSET